MINYQYMSKFWDDSVHKEYLIETDDHSISITNENIHSQKVSINESLTSGSDCISFGDCEASRISFKISNVFVPLTGKWFNVTVTMEDCTPFTIGRYKVLSDTPVDGHKYREVVAYNKIYYVLTKRYKKWYRNLFNTTPTMTVKQFRDAFFTKIGITQNNVNLVNDGIVIKKAKVRKLTGKTILNAIGEINGVFGRLGRDGTFTWVSLDSSNPISISRSNITSIEFEDYTVAAMQRAEIFRNDGTLGAYAGSSDDDVDNIYTIESNFLIAKLKDNYLQNVVDNFYTKTENISYRPVKELELVGNPCLEVGDCISIVTDRVTVQTFLLQRTLNGAQAIKDSVVSDSMEYYSVDPNTKTSIMQDMQYDIGMVENDTETHLQTLDDGEVVIRQRVEEPTSQKSVQFDCCSYNWLVDDEPKYATGTVNFTCSRNFLLVYYADPVGTRTFTIGSKTYTSINYTALIRLGEGETYPDDFIQFTHTGGRTDIICCDIEITEDNKVRWSPCGGQTAGEPGYYYATNWSSGTALSVEDTSIFDVHFTDVYEMWAMCRDGKVLIPNVQNGDTVLPTAQSAENLNTSLDNLANKINGQTNTQSPTFLDPDTNTLSENQYKNTGKALEKIYNNLTGKVSTITNNGRGEVVATVHHYQDDNGNPADIYIRANRNIFEQNADGNTPSTPEEGDWYAQICFESGIYSDMDYVRDYTWSMHSTQWGIRTPNYYLRTLSNNSYYELIGLGSDYDEGQSDQCGCELEFRNLPTDRQVSLDISVVFYRLEAEHSNVPLSYHDEPLGVCFYSGSKPSSLPHTKTGAWHSDTNYQEFNTDSANDGGTVFTYTCTFTPNQSTMYAWLELSGLVLNDGVNTTKKIEFTIKPHGEELVAKKLSFCGLGGKWYDVPMSGGGGDANIDEMTVSQYNALTPAQKEDGTVRFVYDAPATEVAETVLGTSFEYADLSSVNATELQCVVSQNNVVFAGFKFDLTTRVSTALTADELTSVATLLEMQASTNATYNITQDNDTPSCTWSNWDWYNTSTMYLDATDMSNVGVRNSYFEFSTSLIYKTAGSDNNNIYLNDRDYSGSGGGGGSTVIANPTGTPTDQLDTVQIGDTIYEIVGGGSSSGGMTVLDDIERTTWNTSFTLSDAITNYDAILVSMYYTNGQGYPMTGSTVLSVAELADHSYRTWIDGGNNDRALEIEFTDSTHYQIIAGNSDNGIHGVYGLKFCGGSGGGITTDTTELFNSTLSTTGTYTLDDDYENYDFLTIIGGIQSDEQYACKEVRCYSVAGLKEYFDANSNNNVLFTGYAYRYFRFRIDNDVLTIQDYGDGQGLYTIYGHKFTGGGGGSSQESYSTTEQVVGTWIDGKPIYRIVLQPWRAGTIQTGYSISNNILTTPLYGNSSIDTIVDVKMLNHRTDNSDYTDVFVSSSAASGQAVVPNKNGQMYIGSIAYLGDVDIILEYTKTTD